MKKTQLAFFLINLSSILFLIIITAPLVLEHNNIDLGIKNSSNYSETSYSVDLSDIKVMSYNIERGGSDPSTNPEWMQVVKLENPDILICVETEDWEVSGDLSKLNSVVQNFNDYFTSDDPYVGYSTNGTNYIGTGIAILSRFNVIEVNQIALVTLDDASSFDVSHDFLEVVVEMGTLEVHVFGAHLKAMPGTDNEVKREKATEGIINYMDSLGDVPILYMGDLNSFSPEDIGINTLQTGLAYGPITIMVDPLNTTYGTYSSTTHTYTDVYRTLNPTDLGITSYDYDSRIDFIFVNHHMSSSIVSSDITDTTLARSASDHLPVYVTISLSDDNFAPAFTSSLTSTEGHTSSTISFTTNESTYAFLEYDIDSGEPYTYNTASSSNSSSHSIPITGLQVEQTYYYRVSIWDTSNNGPIFSSESSFTTREKHVVINEIYYDGEDTINVSTSGGAGNDVNFANIIITEVLYDAPTNDATEEWIELYNPTDNSISLTDWTISDNIASNYLTGTIESGEYYVFARDLTAFQNLYPSVTPDQTGMTLQLGNSGDYLTLRDGTSTDIDYVQWEGSSPWSIAATNVPIQRYALTDTDTDSDWQIASDIGTPSTGYYSHSSGSTYYSERDEYFVIYNPTSSTVSLDNWIIGDGEGKIQFPGTDNNIISGESLYIAKDADSFYQKFSSYPDYEWNSTWGEDSTNNPSITDMNLISGDLALGNSGDLLFIDNELTDSDSLSIDIVVWGSESEYLELPEGNFIGTKAPTCSEGESIKRIVDGGEGDETNENQEDLASTFEIITTPTISEFRSFLIITICLISFSMIFFKLKIKLHQNKEH